MKIRGSSYFFMVIMALMLIVIGLSLSMESFESKLLPLVIGSAVFILSALGLWREILAGNQQEVTVTEGDITRVEKAKESWRGYLLAGAWVVGFVLGIYVLGFIVAIPVFVLSYMKSHGIRWLVSIAFATITTVLIYGVFEFALGVDLYWGLLFT